METTIKEKAVGETLSENNAERHGTNDKAGAEFGAFPVDTIPEPAKTFIEKVAIALPVAPALVALPVLATVAGAIGNARAIEIKGGWVEPVLLYGATVGDPGVMKSPALAHAVTPLLQRQSKDRRTWTSDTTVEKLAELLRDNPRGLLLYRDELSGWIGSMNQYKQGHGADRQFYLTAWNGNPYTVDRKANKEEITLPRPFIGVIGSIQPDIVPRLYDKNGRDDGFIQRILFAWPEPIPVRMKDEEITREVKETYAGLISGLLALEMKNGWPVILGLEKDAFELFRRWHDSHMAELGTQSPLFDGFVSKLKGYCPRLALLNALMTNLAATTVPIRSVEAAIEQINYFKAQAMKVCRSVGVGKAVNWDPVEGCVKETLAKVTLKGVTKKRDLQRSSQYPDAVFNEAWKRIEQGREHFNSLFPASTDIPTPTTLAVAA